MQKIAAIILALQVCTIMAFSQQAYFIDGYHGGIYGHYPKHYTKFITDELDKNQNWKINLEIEPETWDSVQVNEPENYKNFKEYFSQEPAKNRLEYANPTYGQGYLYNINGESIIRQFYYGIKKLKEHFPGAVFNTYSSEEPCFTSALPQILTSFGFRYASLKNPNTCWGGYTRAFGGEVINWVGPDGTKITTVPRYGIESLQLNSTWQTIASANSTAYLRAAFNTGIKNPVGMCFQDAGWKNGPWLGTRATVYNSTYTTWSDYFKNTAIKKPQQDWNFSQEDVQVSLVWGAQALQNIAKQVRVAENKITNAEKMAAMAHIYRGAAWPATGFDEAWRGLLLAQHHDCWIVPYNGNTGNTWIDKVQKWTAATDSIAGSSIQQSMLSLTGETSSKGDYFIRVFNTLGSNRTAFVKAVLPAGLATAGIVVADKNDVEVPSQISEENGATRIIFKATVAGVGYNTYHLKNKNVPTKIKCITLLPNGMYKVETGLYIIIIDPAKGGIIKSLIAKKLGKKQFSDTAGARYFNELRGFFYKDSAYFSSTQNHAKVSVIEDGDVCSKLQISGWINKNPFVQTITLMQDNPVIGLQVKIDWIGNPGIGDAWKQTGGFKREDNRKAFYNDSDKLQTLFPLNLSNQKVYKDAPFDVTKSKLDNTFFQTWDSIKNNVLLNWVDVTDGNGKYGLALFTDHTTNYVHGQNYPLGLTTQYSGVGLWDRDYLINGPTEFSYAILPHKETWSKADVWAFNNAWANPMETLVFQSAAPVKSPARSLVLLPRKGIQINAVIMNENNLEVRLFNAENIATNQKICFDGTAESIALIELNGKIKQHVQPLKNTAGKTEINIVMPKFGIRTIRLKNFKAAT